MNAVNRYRFPRGWMILLFVAVTASCERLENVTIEEFDCNSCYQTKPEWVQLKITVTINSENPFVPLIIYIGDYEDGYIDWVDTTYSGTFWVDVQPDRDYSVQAEYTEGPATVYAIDGDHVKLRKNTSDCNETCYYQVGGYLDVRLK